MKTHLIPHSWALWISHSMTDWSKTSHWKTSFQGGDLLLNVLLTSKGYNIPREFIPLAIIDDLCKAMGSKRQDGRDSWLPAKRSPMGLMQLRRGFHTSGQNKVCSFILKLISPKERRKMLPQFSLSLMLRLIKQELGRLRQMCPGKCIPRDEGGRYFSCIPCLRVHVCVRACVCACAFVCAWE